MVEIVGDGASNRDRAADILLAGGLVAVPTETVYGLAADATNPEAVSRIYAAKGRPAFNPLIAHVSGLAMAERYGVFDAAARALAVALWPGPLTLVVPARLGASPALATAVMAELDTVALRHAPGVMADLSARLDRPLAAPSANRSGRLSPTTAAHVGAQLGDAVDLILDAGPCGVGLESTIVRTTPRPVILREGGYDRSEIEAIVGPLGEPDAAIQAPGMMASHYAPQARLRLEATDMRPGEALLGFGPVEGDVSLSPRGDLEEAARRLYALLAQLDETHDAIAVAPIPHEGLGAAINDRLRRAAAPRD